MCTYAPASCAAAQNLTLSGDWLFQWLPHGGIGWSRNSSVPLKMMDAPRSAAALFTDSALGDQGPAASSVWGQDRDTLSITSHLRSAAGSFTSASWPAHWFYDDNDDDEQRQIMQRGDGWGQVPGRISPLSLMVLKWSGRVGGRDRTGQLSDKWFDIEVRTLHFR